MYQRVPTDEEDNVTIEKRGQKKYYISYLVIVITAVALMAVDYLKNDIITVHLKNDTVYFSPVYKNGSYEFSFFGILILLTLYYCTRLLQRLYIMVEEYSHLDTRYQGKTKEMIKICFKNFFHITDIFPIFLWFLQATYLSDDELYDYLPMYVLLMVSCASAHIHWDPREIKEDIEKIPSIGDIWANGAWSAYYKNVLEDIEERIYIYEKDEHITLALRKLIILFPLSCDVRGTICRLDADIEYVGNLPNVQHDQGANINRTYINPVYKISSTNEEPVYVAMEEPSSLFTLWKMREAKKMDEYWINYQRDRYLKTLTEKTKNYPFIILKYDDTERNKCEKLSIFLRKNILNLSEDFVIHSCQ